MWLYFLIPFALFLLLFIYDGLIQKKHTIIRNFPIVGRMRYLLEELGPPLRQYWIANDKEEQPFHRDERRWVYASAKGENKNFGFGTTEQLYKIGHPIIKHSTFPVASHTIQPFIEGDPSIIPCAKVMGEYHKRAKPFHPQSIINISAMSFGSLGEKAVRAMGLGAKNANAFHNTGEGGVSDHHKASNADLI